MELYEILLFINNLLLIIFLHNYSAEKDKDTLANESDILCGACGERCNGTTHTCKKCIDGCNSIVATDNSKSDTPRRLNFSWNGQQESASSECSTMLDIIITKVLEEKEFLGITNNVAARRLKNPADRCELILIRDLIGHHFKERVVAESDKKI